MKKKTMLSAVGISLILSSPAAFAMGKKSSPGTSVGNIHLAGDLPTEQRQLLSKDLIALDSISITGQNPELLRILGLAQASSSSLKNWLEDRVQFVVGESFDIPNSYFVVQQNYRFDNRDQTPVLEEPTRVPDGNTKVQTVMSNAGTVFYYVGKENNTLLGVNIPGLNSTVASSPRVGIIQVGPGLFRPVLRKKGGTVVDSMGNTLTRLATFFHEARHSDGNGKSLGFFHAVCPVGHPYEGYSACDRNLNGPYTVGALTSRAMTESCDTCTTEEKEALRLEYLDSFGRVIKETAPTASEIAQYEEQRRAVQRSCDIYRQYKLDVPAYCSNIDAYLGGRPKAKPSVNWDDRPEGRRQ